MGRINKILCIALSMIMLAEVVGFEVTAADVNETGNVEANSEISSQTENSGAETEETEQIEKTEEPEETKEENPAVEETEKPQETQEMKDEEETSEAASSQAVSETAEGVSEAAVSELKAEVTENGVTLTWKNSEEVADIDVNVYKYDEEADKNKGTEVEKAGQKEIGDTEKTEIASEDIEDGVKYIAEVTPYALVGEGDEACLMAGTPETVEVVENIATTATSETLDVKYQTKDNNNSLKDGEVLLSWKAPSASVGKYEVKTEPGGSVKTVESTKTEVIISGLSDQVSYTFTVEGMDNTNPSQTVAKGTASGVLISTLTPGDVTGLRATPSHNQVILSWGAPANAAATGYDVYRFTNNTWQKLKSVTTTSYTETVVNGTYRYAVRSYRTGKNGTKYSAAPGVQTSINLVDSCGNSVKMMYFSGRLKSTAPYFKKAFDKKKAGKLKKGTKIKKTLDFQNKRFLCQLSNGKKVWISKDRMNFSKQHYTKKDYTAHVKTSYVNAKGYKSSTNYLVWTSLYTQRVNIYRGSKGNWTLIRSGRCSSGKSKTFTPMGVFKVGKKEKGWFYRAYYVKPVVHFSGKNSFHSRLYKNGKKRRMYDGTMGKPGSHGCIRLMDSDINFLYKSVPKGSTVVNL